METKKILLGQQDVELKIQLSQIPISSINITFISDNNFKNFDVVPKSLFFDGKYTSIQLEGNTTINVKNSNIKDNNPVIKSFKLKSKKTGSSKLSFDIQSDGNNIQLDEFLNDKLDITVNVVAYPITSIILMVSTAMFLFCIGLSLSGNTLRGTFHKERIPPILCGLICQFVIVPLISILIPKLFKQNNIQVLSVFMVGISPSSVIAPIFTYYLGGDRALAVSLCLISTILGSAVYVIYLYVYLMFFSRSLELTTFPYEGVAFIVIYCLVPLLLGSLLLHFKPLWASWLNKGATFWGALIILTSLIVSLKDAGSVFLSQWYIYCVSIILTSLSFGISVIMSKIFRLNSKKTRAICMNTALPNIPLAITIIQVYINPCCSQILSAFPLFHTFWMLIETIIIGVIMYFFFPAIETINETSEQELNNLPNNIGNTEGLTIITPAIDDDDDNDDNDDDDDGKEKNTIRSNKKRESYHKKKISNSTVGLIRKDPNDPNIEYLDEVTSIGDDESLVLDNNLSNLIIPTTTFTRGSYTY
jgi:predicted Na+-dependent transporter